MIRTAVNAFSVFVLAYFIATQAYLVCLGVLSAIALRRNRFASRYGRLEDMLSSDLSPPVSIIVPAFNEEAGIADSVRSMAMIKYPRFEIVVINDGSTDGTLARLIERYRLVEVTVPHRNEIPTMPIRAIYRSTLPLPITVVDKENGGKTDALNAGTNVARYPYVAFTDADVVMDGECLLRAMRYVVEDRVRTVAVGGNIRPLNGCRTSHGRVVEASVPRPFLERVQVLEYIRSFIAARPGWSRLNALVLVSGAFGIYRRAELAEIGGFAAGHLGEDLDLTMRLHRHMRSTGRPYRIVYAPDAVVWTEVPTNRAVLARQRIRWHRGLMMVLGDFRSLLGNPTYGLLGLLGWPLFVLFEFVGPLVEFAGWVVIPLAWATGVLYLPVAVPLMIIAFLSGMIDSLLSLFLDELFGYFNHPLQALRLLGVVFLENLGFRQQTVWWRIRAMFGGRKAWSWGTMERKGVTNLAGS